jgi:hypothetical protein
MAANLTFYIADGLLVGTAGGHMWHLEARSGGGGGARKNPDGNADTDNPGSVSVKESGHHRGGPLPPGRYRIGTPSKHKGLGYSAALSPYDAEQKTQMFGRSGFFIHGRGPKGSDGCVVPMESFGPFMAALAKDHGGVLTVAPHIGGAPT